MFACYTGHAYKMEFTFTYLFVLQYLDNNVVENIKFYNIMVQHIITATENLIILPEKGYLWGSVGAAGLLLRATEPIHATATLLRTFAWFCDIPSEDYKWFDFSFV